MEDIYFASLACTHKRHLRKRAIVKATRFQDRTMLPLHLHSACCAMTIAVGGWERMGSGQVFRALCACPKQNKCPPLQQLESA